MQTGSSSSRSTKNQEDIEAAFKKVEGAFGGIDVVYNNAVYSAVGEVEAMRCLRYVSMAFQILFS